MRCSHLLYSTEFFAIRGDTEATVSIVVVIGTSSSDVVDIIAIATVSGDQLLTHIRCPVPFLIAFNPSSDERLNFHNKRCPELNPIRLHFEHIEGNI